MSINNTVKKTIGEKSEKGTKKVKINLVKKRVFSKTEQLLLNGTTYQ